MKISVRFALWSAIAALTLLPARSLGQAQPQRIRFETVDEVEIQGKFYAGTKQSPTVVILHKMEGQSQAKELAALAGELSKKGYAVLLFDWRGHGGSTTVGPGFWDRTKYAFNTSGAGGWRGPAVLPKNQPRDISYKKFNRNYYPYLVNDLAAAKLFLEQRNDANDCNASNLIFVCEEDACILAMMWAATESFRFKVTVPPLGVGGQPMPERKPQSRDIVSMIFLSPTYKLAKSNYATPLKTYARILGAEQEVGVALVYGGEDTQAEQTSKYLLKYLKDKKADNKTTGEHVAKKTDLKGAKLLIEATKAQEWILDTYLEKAIRPVQAINVWEKRETNDAIYWWYFGGGRPEYSKIQGERHIRPLPVKTIVTNSNLSTRDN